MVTTRYQSRKQLMMAESHPNPEATLFRGNTRLLPFHEDDPALWFVQVEAIFATDGLTDPITRYNRVIGGIPLHVLTQVSDIARQPPNNGAYGTLRNRLIEVYAQSQERRIIQLIEDTHLGDSTPSRLLRHLQNQAGQAVGDDVIKTIWFRAMPHRVRSILASLNQNDLPQMANVANKIYEFEQGSVAAIESTRQVVPDYVTAIMEEIKKIKEEVKLLTISTVK